jgi:hypothetical protein
MLLLLFVCGGISFLLHWRLVSRPTLISGTVINWMTGQPVSGVMVRERELNGSEEVAWTDVQGRFTAVLPGAGRPYLLYAAGPRFGPLLQCTFGRTVAVYTPGEQHSGIVVPAIPATEISGHVYDEGSTPLPGCQVWALTDDPRQHPSLRDVDTQLTDGQGGFMLMHLGADRFYVMVRCRRDLAGERREIYGPWTVRNSWQPMLFPQAVTSDGAKTIVLLPGERRQNIDFHLRLPPRYLVHGKVIFSDPLQPKSGVTYSHLLRAFPLDPALAATAWPDGESCDWNANTGKFQCEFLSPGIYQLNFLLDFKFGSKGNILPISPQQAKVEVEAEDHIGPELTVRLQDQKPTSWPQPETLPLTGFLHLQRVCPPGIREGWINVSGWGPTTVNPRTFGLTSCTEDMVWPIAPGAYTISAYQADWFGRSTSLRILNLLREHGRQVNIRKGNTSHLVVPVWSTDQIVQWAVESLRENVTSAQ